MRFAINNLGRIDQGSIELGDLTLICGPNNGGKTYASYAIYGLLRHLAGFLELPVPSTYLAQLLRSGTITIDLNTYQPDLGGQLHAASKKFSQTLESYFNVPREFFAKAEFELLYDAPRLDLQRAFVRNIEFGQNVALRFHKEAASTELSLALTLYGQGKSRALQPFLREAIEEAIVDCLLRDLFPEPYVMTSERTGVALFYQELDISKNARADYLAASDSPDPIDLLSMMRTRYARPIQDNIEVVRDYDTLSEGSSFIRQQRTEPKYKAVLDSLRELIGGRFKVVDKQIVYQPRKEPARAPLSIPIYAAASSIKSLFLVDLYINSIATARGMLLIEEPELNLHPDSQRKMAHLLVRLVNAGIKVLITTHSDHLIAELNNCIMLSNDFDTKQAVMQREKMTPQDVLKPQQVKAFSLREHRIEAVEVDQYGVNMKFFDDIIAAANALTDDIYYAIRD